MFVLLMSAFIIDKSKSWGPGNKQEFPNGGFIKLKSATEASHGVQANEDFSAPVGWSSNGDGTYDKLPIHVTGEVIQPSDIPVSLDTLDGKMEYIVTEPSMICFNDKDGEPNLQDCWIQKVSDIEKNYNL